MPSIYQLDEFKFINLDDVSSAEVHHDTNGAVVVKVLWTGTRANVLSHDARGSTLYSDAAGRELLAILLRVANNKLGVDR